MPQVRHFHALLVLVLCLAATVRADPVISEFMADNTVTVRDEDGAYSDWIEIHNPTTEPIDLSNWCLTDDAASLTKWRFPAVTLPPGDFLLVWASNKNRRVAGAPLHTNFALAAGGEFLALVRPDGVTIAQQFAPAFPPQDKDESFGLLFSSTSLVSSGAAARYHVPTSGGLGTTWTASGFNDNSWTAGQTGLGFGLMTPGISVRSVKKNPAFGSLTSLAQTLDLLSQPAGSPQIQVDVTVVVQVINFLGDGADGHYGGNQPFPSGGPDVHCIRATGTLVIPTSGTWTFGLNSDDGGRIRINGLDVMVDDTNHAPQDHFGSVFLAAGSHTFEVIMWEGAGGDEVEFFAAPGNFTVWGSQFKLVGDVANGGLATFTSPVGTGSVIGTNIEAQMRNVNAGAYLRVPFTASNLSALNSLNLRMRYNDGFVAYLNGSEIARRAAPETPAFNSTATAARSQDESLQVEPINVTAALPRLVEGSNVLAIHGLNVSSSDGSFLLLPELSGGSMAAGDPAFFKPASPGSINGTPTTLGKVADTQFSRRRGIYDAPFQLAITTLTTGAQIRYTLDGSTPTATSGTVYTGPLTIDRTTILRAAAFRDGWQPTNADTQTYLFLNDVIRQSPNGQTPPGFVPSGTNGHTLDYGMDPEIVDHTNPNIGGAEEVKRALAAIPSVSIVTDPANLWNSGTGIYVNPGGRGFGWERPCSMELINDPAGGFKVNAGIRIRGGFSRSSGNPKHAFHFFFRGEYGDTKLRYPLFGREGVSEFDQLDLRTSQNYSWSFQGDSNNTFLREEFSRDAQGAMGQPYSRCRYYHLYLNGHYWGLFNTEERTEASYAETYFGGEKDDYDVIKAEQNAGYTVGATDGDLSAWQDLWNKARAHAASPTNANYFRLMGRAADGVTPTADPVLLDVDNVIDYMLLTFWTGNEDGATSSFLGNVRANNWFGLRRRNGDRGFVFFAHDFEHSFGLPGGGVNADRTGPFISPNQSDFRYSNPMFLHQDLMANVEYRARFADRVQKHLFNNGTLTAAAAQALINARAATVESVITAESARWGDSKTEPPRTRLHWRSARDYLLNTFAPARGAVVISQLRADNLYPALNAPTLAQFGGYISSSDEVIMSGPGTIYYTTDGSDPRLIGGAQNPVASTYTSAVTSETLVPLNSIWKYLADGSNQGTTWRNELYNDASWPSGPAELGYGDNDEATLVGFIDVDGNAGNGIQKNATTYFRKTFNVTNASSITALTAQIEYDDGAAIYVNGQRAGLVGANMVYDAPHNFYTGAAIEDTVVEVVIDPSLLREGANLIAVEVHQASDSSSDISFNLQLTASRSQTPTPLFLTGAGEKRLKARSFSGGVWSALVDALFLVDSVPAGSANLAITEIMYNPAPPSAAEVAAGFTDAQAFEWLELTNIGATTIDLDGLYFSAGIEFDFKDSQAGRTLAPGARLLLVANRAAFEFRYGAGGTIAGEYSGNLNNGGELLTLANSAGAGVRTFAYDDGSPWPAEADGGGYSLVLRRTNLNPADPASWRASSTISGRPGESDSTTFPMWKIENNVAAAETDDDGDGLTNWFEYVLGGGQGVNDSQRLPRISSAIFVVGGVARPHATLTFTRRITADDVRTTVESATELGAWTYGSGVLVSATRNADGTETCVYRSANPLPGTGQEFLRLRAESIP